MKKSLGFTLLEILIALFIFSIVSTIVVGALHNVLNIQFATEKKAVRLSELQIALLLMSRDIEQIINRSIINAEGKVENFTGDAHTLTFVHAGLVNPFGQLHRSTLQRTSYQWETNTLRRITWPVLDQAKSNSPDSRILLTDVSELRFEYLDDKNIFQKTWPSVEHPNIVLPRAIRVSLTLKNWGKITQLYLIAGQILESNNA